MLIIGELINSSRGEVKEALATKDEKLIRELARTQTEAGADILDLNAATSLDREVEDTKWLVEVVQDELREVRLSIDTPNPVAMAAGLELCQARPMINSLNNDPKLQEQLIPLIKNYNADVIGLTLGGKGMPMTVADRLEEAEQLINSLQAAGVNLERLYIDSLAMALGSNQEQAQMVIETVRAIKEHWGGLGVKTSVGLSNGSFGLPRRSIINRTFLAMLLAAGLDAALTDPTDQGIIDILRASEALLGSDAYCMRYIKYIKRRERR